MPHQSKSSASSGPQWHRLSTADSPAERSATAAAFDPKRRSWYHFGGLGQQRHGDLWALQFSGAPTSGDAAAPSTSLSGTWRCLHSGGSDAPCARSKASLTLVTLPSGVDVLILFGGWAGGKQDKLADMWAWPLPSLADVIPEAAGAEGTWFRVDQTGQVPESRSAHSVAQLPNGSGGKARLLLFGGIGARKFGDAFIGQVGLAASASGKQPRHLLCHWLCVAGMNEGLPPRSSYGSLHVVPKSSIDGAAESAASTALLFGGLTCGQLNDVVAATVPVQGKDGSAAVERFEVFAPSEGSAPAPYKRGRHATAVIRDPADGALLLLVYGGTDLRNHDERFHAFDLTRRVWRRSVKPAGDAPPGMECHAMALVPSTDGAEDRGHLVVYGGWRVNKGWVEGVHCISVESLLATMRIA